ncbi:MAG: response regulator, partial [Calditrichia bacterium]|nr:response regulator [Calditrichia bacterium]
MKKYKILLLDDDEIFVEIFISLNEREEYQFIPFFNPGKALDFLEREEVDLIISDVNLPDMDGLKFFEKVQETSNFIPFIFITAFGTTEKAIQAVKKGAFHYFKKPLEGKMDLFWASVREALIKSDNQKKVELYN